MNSLDAHEEPSLARQSDLEEKDTDDRDPCCLTISVDSWSSRECLQQANTLQLHVMRGSFGLKRVRGENWVAWNSRTMKQCRCWLAYHGVNRWSTTILSLQHTLTGHWARHVEYLGSHREALPSLSMRAFLWRNTKWWREQQEMSRYSSIRHKEHVHISNVERQLADANGCNWYALATDRNKWTAARKDYLECWDTKWCQGRQAALTR